VSLLRSLEAELESYSPRRFLELTAHLKGNDPRLLLLAGLLEAFTARWLLSNYGISLTASA
jgi:hypothetical protein